MTTLKNNSFLFWQKWLYYTSIAFALAGISFALFGNNFPVEADHFRAFIVGPLGGTITCCYILLAFIALYLYKTKIAGPSMLLLSPLLCGF